MRRFLWLAVILVLGSGLAAGQVQVSPQFSSERDGLQPGRTTDIGNLTLAVRNDTANLTSILTNQLPFTATYSPGRAFIDAPPSSWENRTIGVNVTVPAGFDLGVYSADSILSYADHPSTSVAWNVSVAESSEWNITNASFRENVSVGLSTNLGDIQLENTGNVDVGLSINTTGNLSQYLDITPGEEITVFAGQDTRYRVEVDIPRDTPFGYYAGQIVFTNDGEQDTINASTRFEDNIDPTILETTFPDGMATTTLEQRVLATDNLAVDSVTANVSRPVQVQRNNSTVRVNRSVGLFQFTHEEKTDIWEYDFAETTDISRYYAVITVTDEAGNEVETRTSFDVVGLNATHIVDRDVDFEGIRHKEDIRREVVVNDIDSPFNLTLSQFNYGGNTTIQVGILPPGRDTPRFFENEDETLTFRQQGAYQLVVNSLKEESTEGAFEYNGRLSVDVPPQHYPVSDIGFDGTINTFDFPEPTTVQIKEFEGYIGYENAVEQFFEIYGEGENSSDQNAYFIGRVPSSQCEGDGSWGECTSLSLGELQEAEEEERQAKQAAGLWRAIGIILIVVTLVYNILIVRRKQLEGLLKVHAKPPESEVFGE